jgi:hypothetical protein
MDLAGWTNVAFAGVAVFGAFLLGLAILAYRRAPAPRMALVAGGFLVITVQGVVVGVLLFAQYGTPDTLLFLSAIFEALLLVVLFLATLVR